MGYSPGALTFHLFFRKFYLQEPGVFPMEFTLRSTMESTGSGIVKNFTGMLCEGLLTVVKYTNPRGKKKKSL